MNVSPLHDAESARQQRNMTTTQKKTNLSTKEGVVVNTFIKDAQGPNLNDTYNSLVISENIKLPDKIYDNPKSKEKNLVPLAGIALGVMSAVAVLSIFVKQNAKNAAKMAKDKSKWLPPVTRNVNLSNELTQAVYQMVHNPTRTSIIAGTGVLALSAMAFMGKTFLEGYKDIWTKRKEADIQKNLQEKLINVETQSFSGKIQIIRSMMSKQASNFDAYLTDDDKVLTNFGRKTLNRLYFTSDKKKEEPKNNNMKYILLGLGTVAGIIGLGYFAFKNASKGRTYLQNYFKETEEGLEKMIKGSTKDTMVQDRENIECMFKIMNATPEFIKTKMKNINWEKADSDTFIEEVISKIQTSTTKVNPNIGGDGTAKPAFNSFVDDYRAFFYNWLLDTSNPQFQQLFYGVTGVTAASYCGKLYGDAIKDVQVKKINAETELSLQQRLIATDLRNFKSKKDTAIQPLIDEFYRQASNGKPKEDLKVIADNILFEIKNGPPFVYS